MKKIHYELAIEAMSKEKDSVEKIMEAAVEKDDDTLFRGCELRIELIENSLEEFKRTVSDNDVYITVTTAIEQELNYIEEKQECYLNLKYSVEFDRQQLKIDEQAELKRAANEGLKLTNDKLRTAHLKEALEEDYKALFNKRGNRDNCYHKYKIADRWLRYYMELFNQKGDIEVKDRLWDIKNAPKEEEK